MYRNADFAVISTSLLDPMLYNTAQTPTSSLTHPNPSCPLQYLTHLTVPSTPSTPSIPTPHIPTHLARIPSPPPPPPEILEYLQQTQKQLHEQEDALSMWSPDDHPMPASWALTQVRSAPLIPPHFPLVSSAICLVHPHHNSRLIMNSSVWKQMAIAFTGIAAFGYLLSISRPERPVAKRSYPFNGLEEELGGGRDSPKVSCLSLFVGMGFF